MRLIILLANEFITLPFWPFFIMMLIGAFVLYFRAVNTSSWTLMFRSTYNYRAAAQLLRETNMLESTVSGMLVFTFFLSMAQFLHNTMDFFEITWMIDSPLLVFLFVLFLLFCWHTAKVTALYALQILFERKEIFYEYIIVFMNINIVLGIFLLPMNMLFIYGLGLSKTTILSISAMMVLAAFVLRCFRVYEMGLRSNMKWYNLILYLCTLEIMPIILLMLTLEDLGINLKTV